MSRNKHISKKTPWFSRKGSENKAKPNLKDAFWNWVVTHPHADNPKCWRAFSMFRNASSQNEFRFNTITIEISLPRYNDRRLKIIWNLDEVKTWQPGPTHRAADFLIRSGVSEFGNFLLHFRVWPQAFKAWFCV